MNDELETVRIQFQIQNSKLRAFEKEKSELDKKISDLQFQAHVAETKRREVVRAVEESRYEWERARDHYIKKTLEIKDL